MANFIIITPLPPINLHIVLISLLVLITLIFNQAANGATNSNSNSLCQQSWRYPEDCQAPNCTYQIVWRSSREVEDAIEFFISTNQPNRWTGIIFSQEQNVSSSDGIFAWIDKNSYVMMDAHLPDFSQAISDKHQSVTNISASLLHGVATFRFTRKRNTQDDEDISFSDDSPCPYMIFPVDGGTVNYEKKTIVLDENNPYMSDRRICIKKCEQPALATTNKPNQSSTRPQIPFPSPSRPSSTTSTTTTSTSTTSTTTTTPAPTSTSTTTTSTSTTTSKPPRIFTTTRRPTTSTTTTTTTTTTSTSPPSTSTSTSTTTTTTTTTPAPTRATPTTGAPTTTQAPTTSTTIAPKHEDFKTTTPALSDKSFIKLISSASTTTNNITSATNDSQWCVGRWSHPANCRFRSPAPADVVAYLQAPIDSTLNIRPLPIELSDCGYYAQWQYLEQSDSVEFIIQTKTRNKWIGIGFGNTKKMANSDAIIGLFEEQSGRHFIMDTWLQDHVMPEIDKQQDIKQTYARRENGTTTVRFRRARLTGDQSDFQFTDDSCAYFFFPTVGGSFNAINKRMHKHETIPSVSEQRICLKSCPAKGTNQIDSSIIVNNVSSSSSSQAKVADSAAADAASSSSPSSLNTQPPTIAPNTLLQSSSSSSTTTTTTTTTPNLAEKSPDSTNISLSPSNDLSAELDGSSTSPTTATGASGHSNPFSRLAFLTEPSLRWLAGIGCVATLLAMIVFQACFTVYKNKQAYKQNLYRQSAFKQNTYLHGAYLTDNPNNSNNLVHHHHHQSSTGSEETQTASLRNSAVSKNSTSKQQLAASTASVNTAAAGLAAANSRSARQPANHSHAGHHHNHHHQHHQHRAGHHLHHHQHAHHQYHNGASNPLVANVGQVGPAGGGPFVNRSAAYDNFVTPSASESSERDDVGDLEDEEEEEDVVDEDEDLDEEELDQEDLNELEDYDDDMIMDDSFNFNNQHRPLHHSHHSHHHHHQQHAGHPQHQHQHHHRHSGYGHQRHPNAAAHQHYQASRMGSAAVAAAAAGHHQAHPHHQNQSLHRQQHQLPSGGLHHSQLHSHYRSAGHLMANQHPAHQRAQHQHHQHHNSAAHRSQPHHGASGAGGGGPPATAARPDSYFLPSQRRY